MGLWDMFQALVRSIDAEYDRRIRAASLVKQYDSTGASHHGHIAVHNEHIENVYIEQAGGSDGVSVHTPADTEPIPHQQSTPRQVTQR
jgi:hypothetical protein